MRAIVRVDLRAGVLDPQGRAVAHALQTLGFDEVVDARQSKIIELELAETDAARAHERARAMCEALLANTVIERYSIEIVGGGPDVRATREGAA